MPSALIRTKGGKNESMAEGPIERVQRLARSFHKDIVYPREDFGIAGFDRREGGIVSVDRVHRFRDHRGMGRDQCEDRMMSHIEAREKA